MGEPEIIALDADFGTVQLVFEAAYTAHLNYRESATSVRDKETNRLIFAEEREEDVQRTAKLTVEVEVSFDEDNPDDVRIDSVSVVSPSEGFGIETSQAADSPYK
jgi:hypothetical protein